MVWFCDSAYDTISASSVQGMGMAEEGKWKVELSSLATRLTRGPLNAECDPESKTLGSTAATARSFITNTLSETQQRTQRLL
jgi:hypothetical protein